MLEVSRGLTSEEEDFARNILAVSERTCFLHAFCRTPPKAKVKKIRNLDNLLKLKMKFHMSMLGEGFAKFF